MAAAVPSKTSTVDYFLVENQVTRLNGLVVAYDKEAAEAIGNIQQAILRSSSPSTEKDRPMTPPILRVEYANLEIVLRGTQLQDRISKIVAYMKKYGLMKSEDKRFSDMILTVKNRQKTVEQVVQSFREEKAPVGGWLFGKGVDEAVYDQQVLGAVHKMPPVDAYRSSQPFFEEPKK